MLRTIFVALLTLLLYNGICQAPQTVTVIIQNNQQQPIDNAVARLLKTSDSSVVASAISNTKGVVSFNSLAAGKYIIEVSFTGFATNTIVIYVPSKIMPIIQLQPSVSTLQDVTVNSKKPFLQRSQGKTIVNVEASVTNVGTTVLEVLEKLPGVMVDKDGNIIMQAKKGVLVMIDDKPTYVSGSDLSNLLSSMSSLQVDQIELITNPSAKYDASGNAGIINIKTKKNKQVGFNGTLSLAVGQGVYNKTNNSLVLNYRKGKFNSFFNYSINQNNGLKIHRFSRKYDGLFPTGLLVTN